VLRFVEVPANGKRLKYWRREVAWSDLAQVLSDPTTVFTNGFGWGQSSFKGEDFLQAVYQLGNVYGLQVAYADLDPAVASQFRSDAKAGAAGDLHDIAVRWEFFSSTATTPSSSSGVALSVLPETATEMPGLAIMPYLQGSASPTFSLSESIDVTLQASTDLQGGIALRLRPSQLPRLEAGLFGGTTSAAAEFSATVAYSGREPLVLLGDADGTRPSRSGEVFISRRRPARIR
jgi:hypothetical protein